MTAVLLGWSEITRPKPSVALRRQHRTASSALGNMFLREKLPEELFCRFACIPFHTFQPTPYALNRCHAILRFKKF